MKTCIGIFLLVVTAATAPAVHAQPESVRWSVLDAGFAAASTGNVRVASVLGQPFVGTASATNSGITSGFLVYPFRPALSTGIQGNGNYDVPKVFELSQNYPNPFNPKTVVRSQLPVVSDVRIVIYDVLGREVKVLVNERRAAGRYEDSFEASGLASGVYVYRLTAGSFVQTRKMILLK